MPLTLSFGEILWDIFPDYKKPGGSPANLAYHLHVLENESILISRVGRDKLGNELVEFISEKGLDTTFIQSDPDAPTGSVTVHFKENEPSYTIHQPAAWDHIAFSEEIRNLTSKAEAVCFASLSQRSDISSRTLDRIIRNTPEGCLKVFDINLRKPFYSKEVIQKSIEYADVIKFNETELLEISEWYNTNDLPELLTRGSDHKIVLVTLGAKGSRFISRNEQHECKASPITGQGDFVGVGDAFLACVTHLLLKDEMPAMILSKSNRYAAYIASQKGGMPVVPDDILKFVNG
jgi:fructokinase